jgi:23S rRNA (pseudouridine1915-N3)-methyltransferase
MSTQAGCVLPLGQKGEELSSESFAGWLEEKLSLGQGEFIFVLGGVLGLTPKVQSACSFRLSLSEMTFTHEMSLVILLEQIYRAFSILKGTNYHK